MERYKVILSNSRLLREVELEPDAKSVSIGTGKECMVRFDIDLFFENFEIILENQRDSWALLCGESSYISADGILKLSTCRLEHGDNFTLKYKNSNQEIMQIGFILDFEYETKDYERVIDINEVHSFTIGGASGCDIKLKDDLLGRGQISAVHRGGKLTLKDVGTHYGIYVNGLRISEEEVTISDYDFFSLIGFSFYFKHGKIYTQKTNKMLVDTLSDEIQAESDGRFEYPVFNRNTRIKAAIPTEEISILDPSEAPQKKEENVIMRILPTLSMVAVMGAMGNSSGGGSSMLLRSGLMAGTTIIITGLGLVFDSRSFKKNTRERETKYRAYIEKKREEIEGKRQFERGILEDLYLSPENELQRVKHFSADLFDRIPEDEDFLHIRIGSGPLPSNQPVGYVAQEKLEIGDELTTLPEALAFEFKNLPAAPIVIDGKVKCPPLSSNIF